MPNQGASMSQSHLPALGSYHSQISLSMNLSKCLLNIVVVPATPTSSASLQHVPSTRSVKKLPLRCPLNVSLLILNQCSLVFRLHTMRKRLSIHLICSVMILYTSQVSTYLVFIYISSPGNIIVNPFCTLYVRDVQKSTNVQKQKIRTGTSSMYTRLANQVDKLTVSS